jgi:hypothetical protein
MLPAPSELGDNALLVCVLLVWSQGGLLVLVLLVPALVLVVVW